METKKKLTGKEKFAYGIGAVGKDMVYMLSASYILYYYQDIMGVEAFIMGIILLIARVFDAFNDPIMGILVAKTKTRWGKFRPWLLIGTITNAIILFVMFAAPPALNGKGLVAYAAIFYILWGVTYTMMDIPYWSMIPAFTDGGKEREGLSALARSCAGVGSALVTIFTVMAVSFLGTNLVAKNADASVNAFSTQDTAITAYVIETDADGIATGKVKTYDNENADVNISFSAKKDTFDNVIYITQDNLNYEGTLNGTAFDKKKNPLKGITFAVDSLDEKACSVAVYCDEETYASISEDALSFTATLTSTTEVERVGFKYFALIIAALFIGFITITCLFIKEKSTVDVQTASVKDMFRALLQNDQAMTMVITIVLVNCATYITSNLVIYFFKYDLGGSNWNWQYTIFNMFGGAVQILAMMALFPILRKFFNTIKIFYICIVSAVLGYVILLVMAIGGVNVVYPFLVPCFFIMGAVGVMNVLVTIFLANTVDYGELKNNRRDESVIFSMQTFVVKLASGISAMVASVCLSIFHISKDGQAAIEGSVREYLADAVNKIIANVPDTISNSSVIGLRLTMTLLPMFVLVFAIIIFRAKYILTDEKLEEVSKKLKEKRG